MGLDIVRAHPIFKIHTPFVLNMLVRAMPLRTYRPRTSIFNKQVRKKTEEEIGPDTAQGPKNRAQIQPSIAPPDSPFFQNMANTNDCKKVE